MSQGSDDIMRHPTVSIVSVAVCIASSAARADLVSSTEPIGVLAIQSAGDITLGNSWTVPVTLFNVGYDLLVVEAVGADFEPGGIAVAGPSDWTGAWHSADVGYATGPVFTGSLDFSLTFEDPLPVAAGDVSVVFSAFQTGSETAHAVTAMTWNGTDGFTFPIPATITSLTRSSLASVPVPGAVYLAAIGVGLIGLARKRLRAR